METFFLKNNTQNVVDKLVPDPFLKNLNWAYLWINSLKFYTVCFDCTPCWGPSKYIETKLQTICFYHILGFLKKSRGMELVFLPHFLHNFWRKILLLLYSINWTNFFVWLPLLCEILGSMCIAIVCKPGCDVMNFEVNLIFLIKPWQKLKYLENEKSF